MTKVTAFLLAGLVAGFIAVALGTSRPTILAVGVGPLFFSAMLAGIAITNSWSRVSPGIWRYIVAACLCTGAYVLALFTFSVVGGYSPQILGVRPSSDIIDFHADVWLGLSAAVLVAAICMELVAFTLTSRWSNFSLGLLVFVGFASILVTFIANRQARHYWSFVGILLPVGEALFCGVVGAQLWRSSEQVVRA